MEGDKHYVMDVLCINCLNIVYIAVPKGLTFEDYLQTVPFCPECGCGVVEAKSELGLEGFEYKCICDWSKNDEYGFIPIKGCPVHGKNPKLEKAIRQGRVFSDAVNQPKSELNTSQKAQEGEGVHKNEVSDESPSEKTRKGCGYTWTNYEANEVGEPIPCEIVTCGKGWFCGKCESQNENELEFAPYCKCGHSKYNHGSSLNGECDYNNVTDAPKCNCKKFQQDLLCEENKSGDKDNEKK